jgi:hypothetical protein
MKTNLKQVYLAMLLSVASVFAAAAFDVQNPGSLASALEKAKSGSVPSGLEKLTIRGALGGNVDKSDPFVKRYALTLQFKGGLLDKALSWVRSKSSPYWKLDYLDKSYAIDKSAAGTDKGSVRGPMWIIADKGYYHVVLATEKGKPSLVITVSKEDMHNGVIVTGLKSAADEFQVIPGTFFADKVGARSVNLEKSDKALTPSKLKSITL